MELIRTTNANEDFRAMVRELDAHLAITDEDEHDFYHQYNGLEGITHVVVAYEDEAPVACGALKPFDERTVEVKRMFTAPEARGKGIAVRVLKALEDWAREDGYPAAVLETGKRQPYAIRLYEKCGYERMAENYGQYVGMDNSVCMRKGL